MESRIERRLDRLEHTIYGNGKDGITVRIDRLEVARLSAKERWALYVGPLVSGVIVVAIPMLLEWLAKKF